MSNGKGWRSTFAAVGWMILLTTGTAPSDEPADESLSAADVQFFESRIRPLLAKHCYECHSGQASSVEGELRLDSRAGVARGGSRGPVVVPGDEASSRLLAAVSYTDPELQMPPRQKLPASAIEDLREWVRRGAPDPRSGEEPPALSDPAGRLAAAKSFWAYQPLRHAEPPAVADTTWPRDTVDQFIVARMTGEGLTPSPDAEPETLLRRVTFDLIGLPPTPDESAAFVAACQTAGMDAALAEACERLLASPQFGERWGRHWLDVARFGESSGKEANISFPYAFRYRDYVIDAFNADIPYDRFLDEQIAGDLLPADTPQERSRLLIATGFLAVGTKNLSEMNPQQFVADVVDEQLDALTRGVLGSSVACARCHDHKFDPISMRDYYALAGIFYSSKTCFGTAISPSSNSAGDPLPLPTDAGLPVFHQSIPAQRVTEYRTEMAKLRAEEAEKKAAMWKALLNKEDASEIFTIQDALRILWRTGMLEGELEKVDDQGRALPLTMGVVEGARPVDAPLLERGEVAKPGDLVPRGFPVALLGAATTPDLPDDQSGRLELASWLTSQEQPLTPRVYVNRVWSHLFGQGLVATVDDFGATGAKPSHPELLDYLAARFMREGWSTKKLIRALVMSRTYRQSSDWREPAFLQDPENHLLWRMPKRRLEAEAIRDAMLAASGELDLNRPEGSLVAKQIGDRPISLIGLDKSLPADLDGATYRSVYLPVIRDRLPDVLELFDFAEASLVTGQRDTTNVPVQALYLMNSPFVQARAAALTKRVVAERKSRTERIDRAFQLCLGRAPTENEQERAQAFFAAPVAKDDPHQGKLRMVDFCQALLATAEFRNLD
jgi:hypothetical protein